MDGLNTTHVDTAWLLDCAAAQTASYVDGAVPTWAGERGQWQVFWSVVRGINTITFEGTMNLIEWLQDFALAETSDWLDPRIGRIHAATVANVRDVLPRITARIDSLGRPPVRIVGHSKGAREAPFCHAALRSLGYYVLEGVYFEPPRVGGPALRDFLKPEKILWTQTRNILGPDIVTVEPPAGDDWVDTGAYLPLTVPDHFDIATKHRMPGVIAGINALAGA